MFAKARKEFPQAILPRLGLAQTALESGDLAQSEKLLREVVRDHPENASVHVALGRFLYSQKYYLEAEKSLLEAARLKPTGYVFNDLGTLYAEALNQPDKAIEYFRHSLELAPAEAGTCYALGQLYLRKSDWTNARDQFQIATRLEPGNPLAWIALGRVELQRQDFAQSLRAFQKARELAPKDVALMLESAEACAVAKKDADAVGLFAAAVKGQPNNPVVQLRLGMFHHGRGHLVEADAAYRRALELDPKLAIALNNRAALVLERRADPTAAVGWAQQAVALAPDAMEFKETLSGLLVLAGRGAEGRALLEKIVAAEPDYPAARYRLACLLRDSGSPQDAIVHLRAAIASNRPFPERQEADRLLRALEASDR